MIVHLIMLFEVLKLLGLQSSSREIKWERESKGEKEWKTNGCRVCFVREENKSQRWKSYEIQSSSSLLSRGQQIYIVKWGCIILLGCFYKFCYSILLPCG